ncbi:hypothetical protein [Variovorax sp. YR216]|uniref:hypothetical protein n=1 Tax=Variovorax sp. YR216 TaxID=1882828 RepID=UPI000899A18A|nr:hypothetical protein [Variovorax sp. YR216]SEB08510.1 hypothetical protein SAMN05444680_10785 [Variovorax sp. YR216]
MNERAALRHSLGGYLIVLGLGVAGATATGQAAAGCSMFPGHGVAPPSWTQQEKNPAKPSKRTSIVGMWKVSLVSDGTAYPAIIPAGVPLDFGTAQWHSDGTEFLISGGRAPSTGDVCMGVWEQTGSATYRLKHLALAYASSDSNPPAVPAAFVGPGVLQETVTLSPLGDSYEGTFTIDQYAADGVTLIEHIGGSVTGIRFTVD